MGRRIVPLFDVRPGEAAPVCLTVLYLALVVAAFLLAKPVRNGLFLEAHRAEDLWIVYVLVPVVLSLVVPLYARVVGRWGHRQLIIGTLLFFSLNAVAFWSLFVFFPVPGLAGALYVWVNCLGAIAPTQAWVFAASLFDARQARRLLGLLGAGASLGAIAGGLLARSLAGSVGGAVNLLLVTAGLLTAAAGVVAATWRWVPRRRPRPTEVSRRVPFRHALGLVAAKPYLALLATLVGITTLATQWIGYQFSFAARLRYGADADRLTAWFATFNVAAGSVALLLQMASGSVLGRFGIAAGLLCLPLALGGGSLLVVATGAFWAVVFTAAVDQAVRFSLDKASYELLYAPLAPAVRAPVKALVDIVGVRVAEAIGGVALGVATGGLRILPGAEAGLRGVAAMVLVLIVPWTLVALALARGYVDQIRDSIRAHRLDAERLKDAGRERTALTLLFAKLTSGDTQELLYALSVLERQRPVRHPAVRRLLDHPVADVRRRAIGLLRASGDRTALPEVARLLRDPDLGTRTEALLYLSQVAGIDPLRHIERLEAFSDVSLRAAIAAFLTQPGPQQNLEAARRLIADMVAEPGPGGRAARLEAARLLAIGPHAFGDLLEPLIAEEDVEVARAALAAAARPEHVGAAPLIIERLADPALASEAREALASFGPPVVAQLGRVLADRRVPLAVRREIPAILGRIASPEAERILFETLGQSDAVLRFQAVRALNKLRSVRGAPPTEEEKEAIETVLAAEIIGHYRSYQVLGRLSTSGGDADAAVMAELRRAMDEELERIFRLLTLLRPGEDFHSAYQGLRADDPVVRAQAVEWLDHVLRPPTLRALLVPLLDPHVSVDARIAQAERLLGASVASRVDALAVLLASDDPWLNAAALAAVGAFGLQALEPEVDRLLDSPDALVERAARAAKARLQAGAVLAEPASDELVGEAPAAVGIG